MLKRQNCIMNFLWFLFRIFRFRWDHWAVTAVSRVMPTPGVGVAGVAIFATFMESRQEWLFLPAAKPSRSRRGESPPPPPPPLYKKSRKTQDGAKLIQCKVVMYEKLWLLVKSADCLLSAVCLLYLKTRPGAEIGSNWYTAKLFRIKLGYRS